MKKKLFLIIFLTVSSLIFSKEKLELRIGVVYDNESLSQKYVRTLIETELYKTAGDEYEIKFPENKQIVSKNKKDISKNIDSLLQDKNIDIVIAGGFLSSGISAEKINLTKPLFAPFLINNESIEISALKKNNFNYIISEMDFKNYIESLKKIKNFNKLTLLIDKDYSETVSNFKDSNVEIIELSKDNLKDIYKKVSNSEAILLGPISSLEPDDLNILINQINEKKIFSASITQNINEKINTLVQYNLEKELKKKIRLIGMNILSSLDRNLDKTLSIKLENINPEVSMDMKIVERTGLWPDWKEIANSNLLNFSEETEELTAYTLKELINRALENNLNINSIKKDLEITNLNVLKAKSNYKPNIEATATGLLLDKDRAYSIFTPAEKTLNAGISINQLIFSEDANMNIDVQKKQNEIKQEELKKTKFDLVLEVTQAYMDVLKAETFARIQKKNLSLIKQNLELAKEKNKTGISGKEDIYRLDSEFSRNMSDLLTSILTVDMAKTNLKRIINYPLNENLEIRNITLSDQDFVTHNKFILSYLTNKKNIETLANFFLEEAIETSPELKSLEYGVNIQNRLIKNTINKKFMPTIAFQGNISFDNIISEGAGSEKRDFSSVSQISDPFTQLSFLNLLNSLGNPDNLSWSAGIGMKLPIYSGGEIEIDKKIAESSIESLTYQKNAVKEYIHQKIINNLIKVSSEYSKIDNANTSLDSAIKALDLVKNAYATGLSPITDLLSAQTGVFSAEQYKISITYDILSAIMETERTVGNFYILKSDNEKNEINEILYNLIVEGDAHEKIQN